MLADTGATDSSLRTMSDGFHLSAKHKTCVGVSGTPLKCKVTQPCPVTCEDFGITDLQHSFVIVPECPVNLAGRDLLCALGLTIVCTEEGLVLKKTDVVENVSTMMVSQSPKSPVYTYFWKVNASLVSQKLHEFVKSHSGASLVKHEPHTYECVVHATQDVMDDQFDEMWNEHIEDESLYGNSIMVTEDFMVLLLELTKKQKELYRHVGLPHIVLAKTPRVSNQEIDMLLQRPGGVGEATVYAFHCLLTGQREVKFESDPLWAFASVVTQTFVCDDKEMHPVLKGVPETLWATHKYDVGLMKDATPLVVVPKSDYRPNKRQYPLRPDAEEGMAPIIEQLLADKIIVPAPTSPVNCPLLPVKKSDGKTWRPVHDLRAVNDAVFARAPVVPNPATILSTIPSGACWFSVVDLSNAFFSLPVDPASQFWFTFTFKGKKYKWTRVPQGFTESPSVFTAALQENLAGFVFPGGSELISFVDDILICSPSEKVCILDTNALLKYLASQGHKASLEKAQLVKQKVHYLGHEISQNSRAISVDRIQAVLSIPKPVTKRQLLSFLGCTGFCRQWICEYANLAQPLSDIVHEHGLTATDYLTWTPEAINSFEKLKETLASAPALGIPDLTKEFTLAVDVKGGFYSAVLLQQHGDSLKPVAYYSKQLSAVVRGLPLCARAVAGTAAAVQASSSLVAYRPLTVLVPHAVAAILLQAKTAHLTPASTLHYYNILNLPNVTLKRCNVLNPATFLPTEDDGEAHDCLAVISEAVTPRPDLTTTPLLNPELIYYVDGSAKRVEGEGAVGYAVVSDYELIESARLPSHLSAQAAELFALTRACILAKGKSVTVYTDSRYAFGVVHDYGTLWKNRGFLTSQGTKIQHHLLVNNLLEAILLPSQISVCRCPAHGKIVDDVSKGNAFADSMAKKAGESSSGVLQMFLNTDGDPAGSQSEVSFDARMSLKDIQSLAPSVEKSVWRKKGKCGSDGVWRGPNQKPCLPKRLFPYMAKMAHGLDHVSKQGMIDLIGQTWDAIGFTAAAENYCKRCLVCAQHNVGKSHKPTQSAFPTPSSPFQHIMMDYIELTPARGYKYCLVIVDLFSKWIEAFPCRHADAKTTAKHLLQDVISRHGIPQKLSSDNGSHFVNKTISFMAEKTGIDLRQHCAWHPESAGAVERANAVLKNKLEKMMEETDLDWVSCLPLALMYMRGRVHSTIKLSPHEVLTGRVMAIGQNLYRGEPTDIIAIDEAIVAYCKQLNLIVASLSVQVKAALPKPLKDGTRTHPFLPGDWIFVKDFRRRTWYSARWRGPFQVLLTTPTAVKVKERVTWIHASHCKRAPIPQEDVDPKSCAVDSVADSGTAAVGVTAGP